MLPERAKLVRPPLTPPLAWMTSPGSKSEAIQGLPNRTNEFAIVACIVLADAPAFVKVKPPEPMNCEPMMLMREVDPPRH